MTSFPPVLSAPQIATLETSGYWQRTLCCLLPTEVVFRAQSTEAITDNPFIEFTYDNVDIGDFSAVWPNMVCYISATDDIRTAKYRGRVRLEPTSDTFKIDLNATILDIGDFVIVVNDTDLFARIRRDTLVDGSITFTPLNPQLSGLPSVIVLYDANNDGTEDFTPVQVGIPVDALATSIDDWLWDISGAGTSSIDDPTLEHPTFTFEAGFHYLLRVTYTDDNGTSNYQISHVYCVDRTFNSPVVQPVVTGSVNGDLEDGWTASLTAYADVSTLIDRTHCAVFFLQHFGDDSSTPIVSNILMNGRIRSDTIQTEGSAESGQVQQVTFAVEGITAYLRRLRIPNDIIRSVATPTQWGEMTEPTPYRMACYAAWTYTTLTNICSFSVESGAFEAWTIGGEPRGIEGGYTLDVLTNILDPIKAAVNYSPSGELTLARTVSYLVDRSSVPLVTTFTLDAMTQYSIDRDSSRTIAQVIAFGGSFNTDTNSFVLYTSQSPSIVYGDASETLELTREILTIDSSISDALIELGSRSSNHYAYENSKPLLHLTLYDAYAGVLIPTNFQRWGAIIPASSNTLNIAYGEGDYWMLQSVSLTINTDGTIDVTCDLPAETSLDDAQSLASLLPINLSNMNPVLPVLPNDPAFPTDPLELYPTDTPSLDDLQAIDTGSAAQSYTPWPPDVASQVAAKQGKPGELVLAVNFKSEDNTVSSWTTDVSDDYLMSLSGVSSIGTVINVYSWDFLTVSGISDGWDGDIGEVGYSSAWTLGTGWVGDASDPDRNFIEITLGAPTFVTSVTFGWTAIADISAANWWVGTDGSFGSPTSITLGQVSATADINDTVTKVRIGFERSGFDTTYIANIISASLTTEIAGSGEIDAFYRWDANSEGEQTNVQLIGTGKGLFLDNSQYASIPQYSPSHVYSNLPFLGTGNQLNARMELSSYAGVDSRLLFITLKKKA